MAKQNQGTTELLLLGAAAKMRELMGQVATLRKQFPSLAAQFGEDIDALKRYIGGGSRTGWSRTRRSTATRKRKRRMSAAQRKAVSARMKKLWKERRKQKG